MNEELKFAIEHGIIDISYVQEQIEMNKRKEFLEKHPYTTWEGKDGKWRTYIPDDKSGRKMVKRNTQKEIEDIIIKIAKEKEIDVKPKTFDDVYHHWRTMQDKMISDNSVFKYNTDYKRYFENTYFVKINIENITEEDIKVFICESVKTKKLCKKACKTLFLHIRNVINSARINKIILNNPMEFLQAKHFYKYCTDNIKPVEKRIVSNSDMEKLYNQFHHDYATNPSYITTYAVEFASLTGMRVGEIAAMSWDCMTESYIVISKSEKYNRLTKEYYIDKTKNGKERIFPITFEIKDLLERVKKAEMQNGFISEWVFSNANGRIHAPAISSCSKNKCKQVGIDEKGIHAFRRTVNSKLRCDGVSAVVAASLLGHTEEVNEQYYTFDVSTMDDKLKIVSQVNKSMKCV